VNLHLDRIREIFDRYEDSSQACKMVLAHFAVFNEKTQRKISFVLDAAAQSQ